MALALKLVTIILPLKMCTFINEESIAILSSTDARGDQA